MSGSGGLHSTAQKQHQRQQQAQSLGCPGRNSTPGKGEGEAPAGSPAMQLDDTVVRAMAMGRVFKDNSARVNSLDFHRTDDVLVTAGDDDIIHV